MKCPLGISYRSTHVKVSKLTKDAILSRQRWDLRYLGQIPWHIGAFVPWLLRASQLPPHQSTIADPGSDGIMHGLGHTQNFILQECILLLELRG